MSDDGDIVGAGFSRRGVRKDASRPAPAEAGAYGVSVVC